MWLNLGRSGRGKLLLDGHGAKITWLALDEREEEAL